MSASVVSAALSIGEKLVEAMFPDPKEQDKGRLALLQLQQNGKLQEILSQEKMISTEAASADPWTSRARPSFLYVIYIIILMSFPMGVLHWKDPAAATNVTEGFKAWLSAIPDDMWWLFGAGYLGYTGARSYDKRTKRK